MWYNRNDNLPYPQKLLILGIVELAQGIPLNVSVSSRDVRLEHHTQQFTAFHSGHRPQWTAAKRICKTSLPITKPNNTQAWVDIHAR
jgi:hypothetical protein